MENATQFGIYKVSLFLLLNIFWLNLLAQDYYIGLDGNKHEIEITKWNFNKFYFKENDELKSFTPNEIAAVYRIQSEVWYYPIASLLNSNKHQAFFIPSYESLIELSTDNFRDENFEVWVTGDYVVYEIQNYGTDFTKNEDLISIQTGDVFIYSEKAGFNKIVSSDIEEDTYKVLLSKYITRASLKDSIFNDEVKLKPNKFLSFFDENESPLTAILHNDKDKAEYYIQSLREGGALIVLLNLDLKKIELYRNSGNEKLAKKLEDNLLKTNLSFSYGFLDSSVFNFCKVYISEANNINKILNGETQNIFLNKNLEIDSSIVLKEKFFLFARKGTLYEEQLIDANENLNKKQATSTPVVQEALVIYDLNNNQVMGPFPNYSRIQTSTFMLKQHYIALAKNQENFNKEDFEKVIKVKIESLEELKLNVFVTAFRMNVSFFQFYKKIEKFKFKRNYSWINKHIWEKDKWYDNNYRNNNPFWFHNTLNRNTPPKVTPPNFNFPSQF